MSKAAGDTREGEAEIKLDEWIPAESLSIADSKSIKYSRGFLRCMPQQWFPGFEAYWLPLAHSLGVDLSLVEVKPVLSVPSPLEYSFVGSFDNELMAVLIDHESAEVVLNAIVPGAPQSVKGVLAEYMSRRLLTSLGMAWSGPESSVMSYDSEKNIEDVPGEVGVKVIASVNGSSFTFWLLIGAELAERLGGLWIRQLKSTGQSQASAQNVSIELAHLSVSPSLLSSYLRTGAAVDLEIPVSDQITLLVNSRPWLPAKLSQLDGQMVIETTAGFPTITEIPQGTTRLSVQLGTLEFNESLVSAMAQPGAQYQTNLPLSDQAQLVINNEVVGSASIKVYQGHFVINVL